MSAWLTLVCVPRTDCGGIGSYSIVEVPVPIPTGEGVVSIPLLRLSALFRFEARGHWGVCSIPI